MKFDVLKELSENYALEQTNSLASQEELRELSDLLEQVSTVNSVPYFPVDAVPVVEVQKENGETVVAIDAYDLTRFMESEQESDPIIAVGKIKDHNLISGKQFAILIDKRHLISMREAVETNPKSGLVNVGHATNMLRNMVNKGLQLVTTKR